MNTLPEEPTRDDVLAFLSRSASYGNLGLFVGAGFSKAVLNDVAEAEIALSWGELLKKVANAMGVKYAPIAKAGVSYPQIASAICAAHHKHSGEPYSTSLRQLKNEIARLTSWYPSQEQQSAYSRYIEAFNPAWIITTNYDLVIEAILTGKSISLGPNDSLSAPKGFVPVFHLHGVRTKPKDIIISQEDYVSLFRPTEYRQIKLALTIKESTTLFLGYGLGDVNVLTALDWSKRVFKGRRGNYPRDVVQIVPPDGKLHKVPYRDKNDMLIVEAESLLAFLEEFSKSRILYKAVEERERQSIKRMANSLNSCESSTIARFIDDEAYRAKVLKRVCTFSNYLVVGFISFFDKCIAETRRRSAPRGAFRGYSDNLAIILDTLTAFDFASFPPALFQTAAENLNWVAYWIGDTPGKSFSAKRTWEERKVALSAGVISELSSVAKQYSYGELSELLNSVGK